MSNLKMPSKDLGLLYPYVKYLFLKLQEECKKHGITIICTQTFRTHEYQQSLYNQGRTTKGKIVTNAKAYESIHEYACAFDICCIINGKATWDEKYYRQVAEISRTIPHLEAGYFWSDFKDPPHYQCTMGLTLRDLRDKKIPKFPPVPVVKPVAKPVTKPVVKPTKAEVLHDRFIAGGKSVK